jgi:hypothetical protein
MPPIKPIVFMFFAPSLLPACLLFAANGMRCGAWSGGQVHEKRRDMEEQRARIAQGS